MRPQRPRPRSCIGGAISEEEYVAGLQDAGLVGVEVRDRPIYDAERLESIALSELEAVCSCARGKAMPPPITRSLAGKVWSIKVYARQPS
ncbi:MAG: hypothetical protein JXO72_10555 [Vicinamibacteria bacterium]|nr:hypothetical protein [Vicinamibacteria bacterium]